MNNITYEQFEGWCKHWNYTTDEGFRAMCFVANIIGQNYGNCLDDAKKVADSNNHSDAFKKIVETRKDNAVTLLDYYGRLESSIFDMLEKHDENAKK
jgi:hypothetical protein